MKLLSIFIVFVIVCLPWNAQAQNVKHAEVKIYIQQDQLTNLQDAGLEFDHGIYDHASQSYTTLLTEQEVRQLPVLGYSYELLVEDFTAHFLAANIVLSRSEIAAKVAGISCNQISYPVPQLFPYPGSMGGYLTFTELEDAMDTMYAHHSNLMSAKQSIGLSHEGRNIWMFKISDNPETDESEGEILYTGMHHAREPMSILVPLYYAFYVLENYSTDDRIKNLVDHTEMYFVPCINPDGYVYNQTIAPSGGGLWRKNRRNNNDGSFGVDLNRNYGYEWGYNNSGSSPNTSSNTYRGPTPFSEPETQAIKAFAESHDFKIAFNHHSYSELLIKPFGYAFLDPPTADNNIYDHLGHDCVKHNTYAFDNGFATLGYFANGDSDDWMYGEQTTKDKIFAFTPEIGTTFWPSSSQIIPLCQENMYTCLRAAYLVSNFADLQDWSSAKVNATSGSFPFRITRSGLENGVPFTISLVPLANIASVGSAVNTGTLALTQTFDGSIGYQLAPGIQAGDPISMIWELDNGNFVIRDTVTKYYNPDVILEDACENFNNWTTTASWSVTTSDFFTGAGCITDSDGGNYSSSSGTRTLYLNVPLDLSNVSDAVMTFWMKYNTVLGRDYVQVSASPSGTGNQSDYVALCGEVSRPGTQKNLPANQPTYHGIESEWVREEISLTDYAGQSNVGIRFRLFVNSGSTDDGFYIDDLSIVGSSQNPCVCVAPSNPINTNITCNSVVLVWDPIACVDGFSIRGRKVGAPNWVMLDVPDKTATSFSASGLACNTQYEWQIRSVCDSSTNATTPWSALQTFTTASCNAPVSNTTMVIGETNVTLTWDTAVCAAGYRLSGGVVGSGSTVSFIIPGGGTSTYEVTGLACNVNYEWQVSTICFCQGYVFSETTPTQSFTTLGCSPNVENLAHSSKARNSDADKLFLYPNPVDDRLTLLHPNSVGQQVDIRIFQLDGKMVLVDHALNSFEGIKLNISNLNAGMYLVELTGMEGQITRGKILKN